MHDMNIRYELVVYIILQVSVCISYWWILLKYVGEGGCTYKQAYELVDYSDLDCSYGYITEYIL